MLSITVRISALAALFLSLAAQAGSVQEALAHPARPDSDREDDDRRHPVAVMTFAGIGEGDVVIEIGAGRGYTTELASRMVGDTGTIYAHRINADRLIGNRLPNVITVPDEPGDFADRLAAAGATKGGVDMVLAFFSLHDGYGNPDNDMQLIYRTIGDYLKPGGEFIVLDNSATAGSGLDSVPTLHRIDEEFLKSDIIKAGFQFAGESDVLRNPDDDLESSWFEDTDARKAGYQDRFAFRFRKVN
ncbi:MAG: methyltransferase [Gammaproteobacteria bacterium]|jgi:predicted methyltransferase|nr:methyltransferase [Gammaproteobacteria bacterium]MDH3821416.1 methyltransferase [Gammaproteobacteria bacterium]